MPVLLLMDLPPEIPLPVPLFTDLLLEPLLADPLPVVEPELLLAASLSMLSFISLLAEPFSLVTSLFSVPFPKRSSVMSETPSPISSATSEATLPASSKRESSFPEEPSVTELL